MGEGFFKFILATVPVGAHVPEAGHRVGEQLIPGMLNGYKLSQKKGLLHFGMLLAKDLCSVESVDQHSLTTLNI